MSFFQVNILILGLYGILSYFLFRDKRTIRLYEILFAAIYFPIFIYFYFKSQIGELKLYTIQAGVFIIIFFETIIIFNICKLYKK